MSRSAAERTMAAASGCSLDLSRLREPEQLGFIDAAGRTNGNHARPTFGERAGLVDNDRVDFLHALEGFCILDQDAGLSATTDADHDRHRRGKPKRARTGDDENGDCRDETEGQARLRPPDRPRGECKYCGGYHGRHEYARDLVGKSLNRRAAALRLRHHLDDRAARCRGPPCRHA